MDKLLKNIKELVKKNKKRIPKKIKKNSKF